MFPCATNGRKTHALSCNARHSYGRNSRTSPCRNGRTSSVAQLNCASSNSRTKCPQLSLHNVLWRSRVKVLFFRTYPPLATTGHTHGRALTRMNASDCDVHVHNTYIYKYLFPIDIYICMLLGVSFCSCFQVSLSVLEKWWVLWSTTSQPQYSCGLKVVICKWATYTKWWASSETKWAS